VEATLVTVTRNFSIYDRNKYWTSGFEERKSMIQLQHIPFTFSSLIAYSHLPYLNLLEVVKDGSACLFSPDQQHYLWSFLPTQRDRIGDQSLQFPDLC